MLPTLSAGPLTLRPLDATAAERLAEIVAAPGVREWWSPIDRVDALRDELLNEGRAFAIEVEGELAGWLGFDEQDESHWRHASLDIVLAPAFQDRGLGPAALRLAAGWLVDARGHRRLTIDPARDNARAIAAYAKLGFRPVGVMRRYERGADGRWHDNLLMNLLAEELRRPGG